MSRRVLLQGSDVDGGKRDALTDAVSRLHLHDNDVATNHTHSDNGFFDILPVGAGQLTMELFVLASFEFQAGEVRGGRDPC